MKITTEINLDYEQSKTIAIEVLKYNRKLLSDIIEYKTTEGTLNEYPSLINTLKGITTSIDYLEN